MSMSELEVLVEQLEELLSEGAVDVEDALEIAEVAGLALRLGASREAMAAADAWRAGPGGPLLETLWAEVDTAALTEALDACLTGEADEEVLEEALFDLDDLVAAAVWCGRIDVVRAAAREAERTIRLAPDTFAPIADYGVLMSRLSTVAEHLDLYGYWFALADAAGAGDN